MRFFCHPLWIGEQADFPHICVPPILLNYHLARSERDDVGTSLSWPSWKSADAERSHICFPFERKPLKSPLFLVCFLKKATLSFVRAKLRNSYLLDYGVLLFKIFLWVGKKRKKKRKKPKQLPSSRNWREELALTNLKDFLKPLWLWQTITVKCFLVCSRANREPFPLLN